MSVAVATSKYIRTSPFKARVVIDLVRNKGVQEAQAILANTNKSVSVYVLKAINSAAANAKSQKNIEPQELYISGISADGGPMMKRFKAQAMGRATTIRRRSSHITVELDVRQPKIKKTAKEAKKQEKHEVKKEVKTKSIKAK